VAASRLFPDQVVFNQRQDVLGPVLAKLGRAHQSPQRAKAWRAMRMASSFGAQPHGLAWASWLLWPTVPVLLHRDAITRTVPGEAWLRLAIRHLCPGLDILPRQFAQRQKPFLQPFLQYTRQLAKRQAAENIDCLNVRPCESWLQLRLKVQLLLGASRTAGLEFSLPTCSLFPLIAFRQPVPFRRVRARNLNQKLIQAFAGRARGTLLQVRLRAIFKMPLEEAISHTERAHQDLLREIRQHIGDWKERHEIYGTIQNDVSHVRQNIGRVLDGDKPLDLEKLKVEPLALPA